MAKTYVLSVFLAVTALIMSMDATGVEQGAPQAYTPQFDREELENISIYDKAAQAVVSIAAPQAGGTPSQGAGVVITPGGLILTSSHVVGNASQIEVSFESGQMLPGVVLAKVLDGSDLALIQVHPPRLLPSLKLGDSDKIRVGQKVLAIGNPYGFERTMTRGIVSRIDAVRNRIQTDAVINPGSSGGPLLDQHGYILGIMQSLYNPEGNRSHIGIAFAVPVNDAHQFLGELSQRKTLDRQALAWQSALH